MPVVVEEIAPCKVALNIEITPDQMQRARDRVIREYARYVNIPGFRPGKAPRQLVERLLDQNTVEEKAREEVVDMAFRDAVKEAGVEPFGPPKLEDIEVPHTHHEHAEGEECDHDHEHDSDPNIAMRMRVTVPLRPKVTVGDIEGMQVRRLQVPVTDADVESDLSHMRAAFAEWQAHDGPADMGDRVLVDLNVFHDGERIEGSSVTGAWLVVGSNMPDIDGAIAGMSPGEEKTVPFTFPADFADESLRGQSAEATLRLYQIQRRQLPSDEDLATRLSFDSFDALRQRIRERLERDAESQANSYVEEEVMRAVVDRSTVLYPDDLLESEVEGLEKALRERLEREGMTEEDYLERTGQTAEQLREGFRAQAQETLRRNLVLLEVARTSGLRVSKNEIEQTIREAMQAQNASPQSIKEALRDEDVRDSVENRLWATKVIKHLTEKAAIVEAAA
jgi:trigger factor